MNETVKLLNDLISQAVLHGGDSGGPYYVNHEELRRSVNELIDHLNLKGYKVSDDLYHYNHNIIVKEEE